MGLPVIRAEASKWSVSRAVWPEDTWPDFVSGWCEVLSIISTQYLHTIYTVSTHYLHNIYALSTQYLPR